MSSSSARTIGVAPTIWTALRCPSIRLIVLSSAPGADEVDPLDLAHVDRDDGARPGANSSSRPSCGTDEPAMTPDQRSISALGRRSRVGSAAGGRVGRLRQRRRLPRRRRQLERHRVFDGAVLEGRVRVRPLQKLERQEPRALAAVAPLLHRRFEHRLQLLGPLELQREFLRAARRRAPSRAAARPRRRIPSPTSCRGGPPESCFAIARLRPSSCVATAAVSLPVSPM